MPNNSRYGIVEIRRYLKQEMSQEEMHRFEKAMMDDAFLSDAVEGYRAADLETSTEKLNSIEKEIAGPTLRTKTLDDRKTVKLWWRAAAIFIVIVGLGILTYRMIDQASEVTIASREVLQSEPVQNVDTVQNSESDLSSQTTNNTALPLKKSAAAPDTDEQLTKRSKKDVGVESTQPSELSQAQNANEQNDDNKILSQPRPATMARASAKMQRDSLIDDITGKRKFSIVAPTISDSGETSSKPLPMRSMPVGGWTKYNKYLDSAVAHYSEAKGSVTLEFKINNKGTPTNIIVKETADSLLTTYAINILISGAKWVPSNEQERITLTFNF